MAVSLDAFKVTRHGVGGEQGDDGRWQLTALYSWSQELLIRYAGHVILKGAEPIWIRDRIDGRIIGARFARRGAALDFLRDLELAVSV